jgi:hypothetical protein
MSDILYDAQGIAKSRKIRKSAVTAVLLCAVSAVMFIGAHHLLINREFVISSINAFLQSDTLSKAFDVLRFVLIVGGLVLIIFGINKMWQAVAHAKDIISTNRYHRDSIIEDIDFSNDFPQMYR